MKIECSKCKKLYNIPDERLPEGKIASFSCKNCGTKIRLDLRKNNSGIEKSDDLKLTKPYSSSEQKKNNDPGENSLKDKILESIDELPPMPQVVAKTQALLADSTSDAKKIAEVIETDQGIASKVLKIANSAYNNWLWCTILSNFSQGYGTKFTIKNFHHRVTEFTEIDL